MIYNDIIDTIGVALVLLTYFLNTNRTTSVNGKLFYVMNVIGAVLACYASYLIAYWPFVILEGTWVLVSVYGIIKSMKIKII